MDEFAAYSAAHRIEYWLRDEPELFSEVRDTVSALQNDLNMMLNLLGNQTSRTPEQAAQVRQIVNDAEEVIDSFVYDVRSVDNYVGLAKVGGSIFNIQRAHLLGIKIEDIQQRIQDVVVKLKINKGKGSDLEHHSCGKIIPVVGGSVSIDKDDEFVVGFKEDVHNMVQQLTAKEGDDRPYLFFIVGSPGAGKTTLAKKLYNDNTLRKHFHAFIWLDRPEHQLRHLQAEILGRATGRMHSGREGDQTWVDDIGKCLIFIDDITVSMTKTLGELLRAFPSGMHGTMFVITCSNEETVPFKDDLCCYFYQMREYLNEEQGWKLLAHLAHPKQDLKIGQDSVPEMLGKDMLKRCEGQPTAIMLLGGLLSSKNSSIEEWETVWKGLTNGIANDVEDVFELSYADLSYYLKACLLYLILFPPKHQIRAGVFGRMWIAEGFEPTYSEDTALKCLEELFHRHFIQVLDRNHEGKIKVFRLQSRVLQFCIAKATQEDFIDIHPHDFGTSINSRIVASHSRWYKQRSQFIRSLFQFEGTNRARMRIETIYNSLKLLRVLTLWGILTSNGGLPDEIGSLVHLKYLALRHTNIMELPVSIQNMNKLLTLDWRDIVWKDILPPRIYVPNVLWKMIQLRHLYVPDGMPYNERFKLYTLNNLYILWGIRTGGWLIDDIKFWNFFKIQKLYLKDINQAGQLDAIVETLYKLPNLRILKLRWWQEFDDFSNMEPFQKYCGKLSKLILSGSIKGNVALRFPPNLRVLILEWSRIKGKDLMTVIDKCCPNLKVLKIKYYGYLGTEMTCRACSFQELEELEVSEMINLESWIIERSAFPCLKKLTIIGNQKLAKMPQSIKFIHTIKELKLEKMPRIFCDKLVKVEGDYVTTICDKSKGDDFYIIEHIPKIKFFNIFD